MLQDKGGGMKYGKPHYCQCGAKPVKVLSIMLGIGTGRSKYKGMKRTEATLPLCADCLEKERRQEAERYGRGEDRRAHFRPPGVWR